MSQYEARIDNDSSSLDLSSFPLLRIDEVSRHETSTLLSSDKELSIILSSNTTTSHSSCGNDFIVAYASRLQDRIREEIENREAQRRVNDLLLQGTTTESQDTVFSADRIDDRNISDDVVIQQKGYEMNTFTNKIKRNENQKSNNNQYFQSQPKTPKYHWLSKKNSNEPAWTGCNRNPKKKKNEFKQQTAQTSFFVSSGINNHGGIKKRAEAARLRMKARSQDATESRKQKQRQIEQEKRRQLAAQRLTERRARRQQEIQRKKHLAETRKKRKLALEAEQLALSTQMKEAAETAKQKAVEDGKSEHEATLDAAIAAAQIIQQKSEEAGISSESGESLSDAMDDISTSASNSCLHSFISENMAQSSIEEASTIQDYLTEQRNQCTERDTTSLHTPHESDLEDLIICNVPSEVNIAGSTSKSSPLCQENKSISSQYTYSSRNALSPDKCSHLNLVDDHEIVFQESLMRITKENGIQLCHESLIDFDTSISTDISRSNKESSKEVMLHDEDLEDMNINTIDVNLDVEQNSVTISEEKFEHSMEQTKESLDDNQSFDSRYASKTESKYRLGSESYSNSGKRLLQKSQESYAWEDFSPQLPLETKETKYDNVKNSSGFGNPNTQEKTQSKYEFAEQYPDFYRIFTAYYEQASPCSGIGLKNSSNKGKKFPSTLQINEWTKNQWKLTSNFESIIEDATILENSESDSWDEKSSGVNGRFPDSCSSLYFRVGSTRSDVFGIVNDSLSRWEDGPCWKELPSDLGLGTSWNLLWTWSKPRIDFNSLLVFQKVNHFRNSKFLTRKDLLKKKIFSLCSATSIGLQRSIHRAEKQSTGRDNLYFEIMPQTYILPQEYNAFVAAFVGQRNKLENKLMNYWILKPSSLSRGRGISLINDIGDVSYADSIVMQLYVMNPLLIEGYKFDLRIYVLVTSFNPLEAFIYREGFARFSSKKFSTEPSDINDEKIHLTNSSIQRKYWNDLNDGHPVRLAGAHGGGNKVSLTWLWQYFKDKGYHTDNMWESVSELCLKTLLCVEDEIPFQPNAFEVYGFDVMFDDTKKPWLIEVNSSPSMSRETDLDRKVKETMVRDTINLLDPPQVDRRALKKICYRRMNRSRAMNWKTSKRSQTEEERLDNDIRNILMNKLPRQYGIKPSTDRIGNYECLAPGIRSFDMMQKRKRFAQGISNNITHEC